MKKYHRADVLSFTEVICAFLIGAGIVLGFKVQTILLLFGAGELCDAFDGVAARRWPYPDDGKRRPWRNPIFIKYYEWTKDILLVLITLLYIAVRIDWATGLVCIGLSLIVGFWMQWYADTLWVRAHAKKLDEQARAEARAELEKFYIKRRVYTYVPGIAALVMTLLYLTEWALVIKTIIVFGIVMGGIFLWYFKEDRRTHEDVSRLPKPSWLDRIILRRMMGTELLDGDMETAEK